VSAVTTERHRSAVAYARVIIKAATR